MATQAKRKTSNSSKTAAAKGAGSSAGERSAEPKKSFGKSKSKTVKPAAKKPAAAAAKSAPREKDTGGIASTVVRAVKNTAMGAVSLAASVIGRDGKGSTGH